ncbi:MAG: hypothetical protein MUE73_10770 [Planctomycetes bacterium]|nr:hypothetical protein [Planctomycetota bacterium]
MLRPDRSGATRRPREDLGARGDPAVYFKLSPEVGERGASMASDSRAGMARA